MKYLYCLVRGQGSCHGFPAGVDRMAIHCIRVGEIGTLVSDVDPTGAGRRVDNALAHHGVVNHALAVFPAVLPCRFGTVMRDEAEAVGWLIERYGRLASHLDQFQGRVEMGIKAILEGECLEGHEPPTGGAHERRTAGTRYLLEKRARFLEAKHLEAQAERLVHTLQDATSPFVEAVRTARQPFDRGLMLSVCCLLERTTLTRFKQGYEQWRLEYPQVRFLSTGPWPPYSFAEADLL